MVGGGTMEFWMTFPWYWECQSIPTDELHSIIFRGWNHWNHQPDVFYGMTLRGKAPKFFTSSGDIPIIFPGCISGLFRAEGSSIGVVVVLVPPGSDEVEKSAESAEAQAGFEWLWYDGSIEIPSGEHWYNYKLIVIYSDSMGFIVIQWDINGIYPLVN